MSEIRPRFIRMIPLRDIFLIFFSWVVKQFLDFVWKKAKIRLRFEGRTHIGRYLFVMFGVDLLMFMFGWILYIPEDEQVIEYQELVRRLLKLHRRYHQFVGKKPCCVCLNIIFFGEHLEKYVSDLKLYPPFTF